MNDTTTKPAALNEKTLARLVREVLGPDPEVERARAECQARAERIRAKMRARDCWAWVGPR